MELGAWKLKSGDKLRILCDGYQASLTRKHLDRHRSVFIPTQTPP